MPNAPRIITDPRIMMGKPVIEGTRITVELILTRLAEGRSVADILTEYPHLTRGQVTAAIEYARALVSHPAAAAE
jgi:uncharacterized protein (DUF433 family)